MSDFYPDIENQSSYTYMKWVIFTLRSSWCWSWWWWWDMTPSNNEFKTSYVELVDPKSTDQENSDQGICVEQ